MPQSYTSLHYHVVFSTKNREPTIVPTIRDRLYDYLGALVRGEGGVSVAVGGMPDHIHMLVRLRPDRAVSDVLRVVKTNSSKWAHQTFPNERGVWWQAGSGMFAVSRSMVDLVAQYITGQEEHHKAEPFPGEFRRLLIEEGIGFDEQYLWD